MSKLRSLWDWLKNNWKWIIFPVGVVSFLLTLLAGSRKTLLPPIRTEGLESKKDMELQRVDNARDAKLEELADAHAERLASLTSDQERELEDLTEKPIEEVVKWFDKL